MESELCLLSKSFLGIRCPQQWLNVTYLVSGSSRFLPKHKRAGTGAVANVDHSCWNEWRSQGPRCLMLRGIITDTIV